MADRTFKNAIQLLCRSAGVTQKALAKELHLTPSNLSSKLANADNRTLTHPEIKQIIKLMAQWGAISHQSEVEDLLSLAGLSRQSFRSADWTSPPLNELEAAITSRGSAQLVSQNLSPSSKPSSSTVRAAPRLLVNRTSFVGREDELAQIHSLLSDPHIHLLTLTGTGGVGKTRLALQAIERLQSDFDGQIYFISLAALKDPALLAATVAQHLNLKEQPNQSFYEVVREFLRHHQALLVLDNFEHLASASDFVSSLLNDLPHPKLFVTSRSPLGIYGERILRLRPLTLPNLAELDDPENLSNVAAIKLFLERTRAVSPSFNIKAENAKTIAEICVRLDGLPLALELVAPHIKILKPAALLEYLNQSLALLQGGPRDLPDRHQALQNSIFWSYQLLTEQEKTLLGELAIFPAGLEFDAVEYLYQAHSLAAPLVGRDAFSEALLVVENIVNYSLLEVSSTEANSLRLYMLETIREFVLQQLEKAGQSQAARQFFAAYCLQLARKAKPGLSGPELPYWLDRVQAEQANFRAALEFFYEQGRAEEGLQLACSIARLWCVRGPFSEGISWLEKGLGQESGLTPATKAEAIVVIGTLLHSLGEYGPAIARLEENLHLTAQYSLGGLRAKTMLQLGIIYGFLGEYARAKEYLSESLTLSQREGEAVVMADSLVQLGGVASYQNELASAISLYQRSLQLYRQIGDPNKISSTFQHLGSTYYLLSEYTLAKENLSEALTLSRGLKNDYLTANNLGTMAQLLTDMGDYQMAEIYLAEALQMHLKINDRYSAACDLHDLGHLHNVLQKPTQALSYNEQSLAVFQQIGSKYGMACSLVGLGYAFCQLDRHEEAEPALLKGLTMFKEAGNQHELADGMEKLSWIYLSRGQFEKAARIMGSLVQMRESGQIHSSATLLKQHRHELHILQSAMPQPAFTLAWESGQKMSLEQLYYYLLDAGRDNPNLG